MNFYPVIMCGGSGTRLWPLSRPRRPKQFIPLVGDQSSFQNTLLRLAKLPGAASPIVVAGLAHAAWIELETASVGVTAEVLLEPVARDSAAAIAAAAAWVMQRDPTGVVVIVASDHHIPDDDAFTEAVVTAGAAAEQGWVVTLGINPTVPATAYGYIRPGDGLAGSGPVRRTESFVEKPDLATAEGYLKAGYLWNSGNFIARAEVLLEEIWRYEPAVAVAAVAAVKAADLSTQGARLGSVFSQAPKISFDYAVMERTGRAAVLPVSFVWSDLGAWDAVWAVSPKDENGNSAATEVLLHDTHDCLVRADSGLQVALVGGRRLAVVADKQSVLICDLESSQGVKTIAELAERSAKRPDEGPSNLAEWSRRYDLWLRTSALPLWWSLGGDHIHGGFHELIGLDGVPPFASKRARVQARQIYVYARAAKLGLPGPWLQAAEHGWWFFDRFYRRADGLYRTLVSPAGEPVNDTAFLYDQAFALMALAALQDAAPERANWIGLATDLLGAVKTRFSHGRGGYSEAGEQSYQANPQMHLLEAALTWMEAGGGGVWRDLAQELVDLAMNQFIDPRLCLLREFFEDDWRPAATELGYIVEPGHQFEWAWLLDRWAQLSGSASARETAHKLFKSGLAGWDSLRRVAVDELDDTLRVRRATARLWPQTEMLKAAIVLGRGVSGAADDYGRHAMEAAAGLWSYLDVPAGGLWRDKMAADGAFVVEPAPASSLYHLIGAVLALGGYQPDLQRIQGGDPRSTSKIKGSAVATELAPTA